MITETELVERLTEILNSISREDFLIEANRILGTDYTIEDIDWGVH